MQEVCVYVCDVCMRGSFQVYFNHHLLSNAPVLREERFKERATQRCEDFTSNGFTAANLNLQDHQRQDAHTHTHILQRDQAIDSAGNPESKHRSSSFFICLLM